ncbi:MT-A70-domain-containing protein [Fennellomyces sp. T-0311]|nr:MT-A70-domain-containing protein [Fennellomyces sp. T-0311]
MSIIKANDRFTALDCTAALSHGLTTESLQYQLQSGQFNVDQPYYTSSLAGQKRKRGHDSETHTAAWHETDAKPFLLTVLPDINVFSKTDGNAMTDAGDPIDFPSLMALAQASQRFFHQDEHIKLDLTEPTTAMDTLDVFHQVIHNQRKYCATLTLGTNDYLVPPGSAFLMSDLTTGMADLVSYVQQSGKCDLIVMDPPWPNKSVRRSSKYETQDIYDLFQIPIPELLAENGMVAVWVTNKPKFRRFVVDKLFKSWGLEQVGHWYWLKVTTSGVPVIPLDSPHRKPYEQLILGMPGTSSIPRQHAIVSVPCRQHSRKPPLAPILNRYLKENPRCLELFARCLTPGWTSWGNECLKFQHKRFFSQSTDNKQDAGE